MKSFLLLLFCHFSSPVKHSMKVFYTASSGVQESHNFPEVVAVMLIDGVVVAYCDSRIKTALPKQDWMEKLRDGDPKFWKWYTGECTVHQQVFRDEFISLKKRLNHTGSIHILQKMFGCEQDEETGHISGFHQYGYNGEDFLVFHLETQTWIAPTPQSVMTKHMWDRDRSRNDFWKIVFHHACIDCLNKLLDYGRSSVMRTDLPSVSLLQKSPSSPVSCHATGFYPDRAMMFWRKDGEEIHEDVDHGEILPNHDGSFQMSSDLDVSSVPPEDWRRYDCVFHLSGVKDDIVTKLDKAVIRANQVSPSQFPAGPVIGVVVGLVLLTLCITGVFIWRNNNHGFKPANSSDSSSSQTTSVTDAALD
ncbi:major histocompatibility complex class I-related gene protein-like isoform X2 [Epinephelus fuscoguttatus]|uniref:major histocompatibility complex class I-related gene protein-like isoform X2 n=1 Tax=Epinephelus fuscoguttatus TaxID=293821 RepID=UPI0020D0F61E|nr:major histocompatibility complex class I-related gene protein-like isoform X2 [Epinephelus fuscoguttatus]